MRFLVTIGSIVMLTAVATSLSLPADGDDFKSLVTNASGQGVLKIGKDELRISSVVVNLKEDGQAEITLLTDTQILVTGQWSHSTTTNQIVLKVTGGVVSGGAQGSGKLLLREDGKSIDKLTMEGKIRTASTFTVDFQANSSKSETPSNATE